MYAINDGLSCDYPACRCDCCVSGNHETARGVRRGPSRVCVRGLYSVTRGRATEPHLYLTHSFHMSVRAKPFQLKPPIRAVLLMRASRYV